ncbi:hypothetical protein KBZ10_07780 [Streptomyces sp. F63]|uniref:hypothetical protein n=1 Tax=Streptomyces sp. F63 TaxID=2824887 RepID=UPI001B39C1C4|nr:hypothetical protein [Streptomyces sp. F63]MBQ0984421.1 hypothetical protein [Streptomyces sp. F63]
MAGRDNDTHSGPETGPGAAPEDCGRIDRVLAEAHGRIGRRHAGGRRGAATHERGSGMFVFFSNRSGCLGSLLISLAGTALLFLLLYSCQRV